MKHKKIALIKMGSFSLVNSSLEKVLKIEFPDFEVDVIDIDRDLFTIRNPCNMLAVIREYGLDFLLGKRKLIEEISQNEIFARTTYFHSGVKKAIAERLVSDEYVFSIQTQSLFDGSRQGIPHFVYTDHSHLANLKYPKFNKLKLYSQTWVDLERKIYQNATTIFTMSNFVSKNLIDEYQCAPEKVVCVYSGINVEPEGDIPSRKFLKKNILFVGINWERKGGPLLVDAFKRVLMTHPDATLTIVGCKPNINMEGVSVIGRVPSSEVSRYYMGATLFCMPSKLEPSAAVIAEAAAHGLPIISTNIGGTPDRVIHGETGYLIEPGNVDMLVHNLNKLLGDSEKLEEFGQKGQQLTQERFRWKKVGERIRENIESKITM